jgi:hypothetical protein
MFTFMGAFLLSRSRSGEKRFEVIKACLRCAREFDMLTSDMVKFLGEEGATNERG